MAQGLGHGETFSATVPSSLVPLPVRLCALFAGHSNGTRTSSRPPPSRAASTTRRYLPGASEASGALSPENFTCWMPAGFVGPVTPSIGKEACSRPFLRHQVRSSFSHFVPPSPPPSPPAPGPPPPPRFC